MIRLGLTGSIGMGKSTTAAMFTEAGIPVHDSDAAVHELYRGDAAPLIETAFPGTVMDGIVDRKQLGERVLGDAEALGRLEAIVHPLVAAHEAAFVERARADGAGLVVLDIPLLFEVGAQDRIDKVLVVTAPADVQRERVLARPGMTEDRFAAILARQVPDREKRAKADFIIDTSLGMDCARAKVRDLITVLQPPPRNLAEAAG
ncbi:MAG: dephospho-CoA kinase [Roseitalea sp.]|uniref:Dephospho-CoA kinase n=1 Tax=Oceaniradius stylonematis TaxID=2184161 RepID=A0A3A8AD76_9HYPH|nr:dephospho-CoA kinase [Oceaniradius stylonematis]MBO6553961.1 dephospho-CoA kinase [Roseitalea sp.]MBO6952915.1 dephospho-CoA kinase [Rhizobiaceae bacterium]MBO6593262.1 dephospho-CoA kinase [Roseitalea sp.]MBO6600748.1 dephospho-CoA kinase [Roseitalea sp.]MBO6612429.1 dephospho-CoA kinase [Roseitalea sp.]